MACRPRRRLLAGSVLVLALVTSSPTVVRAQDAPVVPRELLDRVWGEISGRFAAELAAATTPDARQDVYVEMFEALLAAPEIAARRDQAYYQRALERLAAEVPDTVLAKSVNAPLGNPAAGNLVERSGFTDLVALAADLQDLFASNDSAISLNLNALAAFNSRKSGAYSAPYRYRQHAALRRLGGTITFGAKIPEQELTGFSGVPDAERLTDVFVWDLKVRVAGDRDPRAARWYPLLLGEMGDATELAARLATLPAIPDRDVAIVARAANQVLGSKLDEARQIIGSSLQASVKVSGQHLTEEQGKNKYSVAGLLDKGFGGVDVTLNVAYSIYDEMRPEATDPFQAREVQAGVSLSSSLLKDVIVTGRSGELSASVIGRFPADRGAVPVDRKTIWKAGVSLTLPFTNGAKIPVSVTYSNDPNNLANETYVTGYIGISYDFGALLRPLGGSEARQ